MQIWKCPNCFNWYIQLSIAEGEACQACAEGRHAQPTRGREVDCHWGHGTPTHSEIKMTELEAEIVSAVVLAHDASKDPTKVRLGKAEVVFAKVEMAVNADMPQVLSWAGVMEMPGMQGEVSSARFKNIEAMEELVRDSRRPTEDLDVLRRSVKNCDEIASRIPEMMAELRIAIGEARDGVSNLQKATVSA